MKEQSKNLFQGETLIAELVSAKEFVSAAWPAYASLFNEVATCLPLVTVPSAFQKQNCFRMVLADQRCPDSFRMTNKNGAGVEGLTLLPSAPHFRNNSCLCLHPQALNVGGHNSSPGMPHSWKRVWG